MCRLDGLSSLQMCVSGDDYVRVLIAAVDECPLHVEQQSVQFIDGVTDVELQVC